jgi:membrane-associated protease RseP (regulator of RpoE activity)
VRLRLKSVIAGSLLCAACGPISKLPPLAPAEIEAEQRKQQIDQVRDYFAQRGRLHDVAFRIRAANHRDCENRVQADIGLSAGTVESLPRKFRSFAHEALSVSWTQATVLSVAGNSPAAAAGIRSGDLLLTFNNEAVPRTDPAGWIGDFARNNGERPIQVLVRRLFAGKSRQHLPRNHASGDARAVRADTKSCCGDCRQAAAQQTANSGATSHRCRD